MITHYDVFTPQHGQAGPPPTLMKYVWFGQSSITINEHTTDSPASYGHANAVGAEAVGAAFYLDTPAFGTTPPLLESFSSQGGVPILFDVSGNSLGVPGPRLKPEIVAPDGTNTSFFFSDTSLDDADEFPETFPNFFGTSAAAPHAAAIAALMLEANPTLTPGDIYSILEGSAVNMGPAGFDFDTGYGLIDATAAIAQATGGNLTPLAENDAASTDQNLLVSIPVLLNDALGDQPTTITLVTDPPNGSATINGTSIDYTPDTDYFGPDSFSYTIADSDTPAETSVATVNVTVNEVDVLPNAVDDNAATDEDVVANNIDVMVNDIPIGNAPTTITAAGPGIAGSNVSTDGSTITYDPAPNYFGNDTFPYTITDSDGDSSNANLTVSVSPVNDPPVAVNDLLVRDEDTSADFDDAFMLAGDTDIENDPLSIFAVALQSSQLGTVSNHGNGTYTYMPPLNFNGNDTISYTIDDGNGGTDTAAIAITVTPVNDAPDAAIVLNQNNQDGDPGISVDASTTDIENDTLSYLIAGQPAGLSINSATGEITGAIDANASAGGAGGVYTVIVTATDGTTPTPYQFTWTVNAGPVNGSPNPGNVSDQNSVDGESGISVSAATTDPEGDTISYSLSGQPAGVGINSSTGLITGTIANDASLGSVYTVTVTADDTLSTPTQYLFSWTVSDPAPVAATVGAQASEDGESGISVDASTTDPDGDTLSYSLSGEPAGVSINSSTGQITGTIANNASLNSPYNVTVTASDGTTPTQYLFSWTVTDPAPVAASVGAQANEDGESGISVDASTTDPDGDTLSYSVSGEPAGVSINSSTGQITGTIANNASLNSPYNVTVTASDGTTPTQYLFSWTVTDPAPVAASVGAQANEDGESGISVDASTTDPDGDTLSYSVSGEPAGVSINSSTGQITGTIDSNASQGGVGGVYTVIVTATDGTTPTPYQFTWTVNAGPVNGSPNPGNVSDQNSVDGESGISVSAATTDPEGDTISYSLSGQPAGVGINSSTGLITGTIANDASLGSVYTVTVTADDTLSTPTQYLFSWTVSDPAPVAATVGAQASEDGESGISVDASTTDPDGDTLSYSLSGEPAGVSINSSTGQITGTIANNASLNSPYNVTVTASDGTTPTQYLFSWTVTAPPSLVHVGALDGSSTPAPRGRWDATVIITVHNTVGGAVSNATVNGSWSNGTNGGATCDTDASGQCSVVKQNLKGNVASVDFTVGSITGAGTYDPGANNPLNATVTVFQNGPPADLLPNAVDDSDSVFVDTLNVPISVLDNDSLGDAPTEITDVTVPPNGTAVIVGSVIEYTPDPGYDGADSFDYTITDVDGDTSSATVSIDVVPDTGPVDVHIGSLAGSSASAPKNRWDATVTIAVHNGIEGAIANATVNGTWSNGTSGSASCVTNSSGQCNVLKNNLKGNVGSVTFTVDTVTGTNLNYLSGLDHDPGSSVIVSQ